MTIRIVACILALSPLCSRPLLATDFSGVFEKVDPAVVVIHTRGTKPVFNKGGLRQTVSKGLGSGVIVSPAGLILTAAHVVRGASDIAVTLTDGTVHEATVRMGVDRADVALIKIIDAPEKLPYIPVSDSDRVKIGTELFVVGAPLGLQHSLSTGHLSARRVRGDDDDGFSVEFLQTDAAVNLGNSGGPLFTAKGELIGVVSFIMSQSGGSNGLGFAVSSNSAKELLMSSPTIWLGLDLIPVSGDLARALNLPREAGLLVQSVTQGSLAAELGVVPSYLPVKIAENEFLIGGDIILSVGGHDVYLTQKGRQRIADYLASLATGDLVELTVLRKGNIKKLSKVVPDIKPLGTRAEE